MVTSIALGQNQIATVGFNLKKQRSDDVKVAGSVTGNNDVAGIVNKIDEAARLKMLSLSVRSTLLVITQQLVGLLFKLHGIQQNLCGCDYYSSKCQRKYVGAICHLHAQQLEIRNEG